MDAYIFQAELLCEACAKQAEIEIESGKVPDHMGDPDQYPQGPIPQGGGEADSPQHCGHCGKFLENPLTKEGDYFVGSLLRDDECPGEWVNFYSYLDEAPYA
jgi:hypothetical protein